MSIGLMSVGWYVRFIHVSDMEVMSDFYRRVVGLPRSGSMRHSAGDDQQKDYLWGGENIILNHNYDGHDLPVSPRESVPEQARQVPIFRVSDLDAALARVCLAGASIIPPRPCFHGREAFIVDPVGMLLGLRQRDSSSPLSQDWEAARRRGRGEAFNPGCASLPRDWQELGWVRLRAADFPALRAFYRDRVGLVPIVEEEGCALFDLGDNSTLELLPGGQSRPIPKLQMASQAAMIVRVVSVAEAVVKLKARNVHFVHELFSPPRGDLAYIADPEGNVIGLADRLHPAAYAGQYSFYPEDLEAQRRWVESQAG